MHTPSLGRRLVLAGVVVVTVLSVALDVLLYVTLRVNLRTGLIDDATEQALLATRSAGGVALDELATKLAGQGVRGAITEGDRTAIVGLPPADGEAVLHRDVELGRGRRLHVVASLNSVNRSLHRLVQLELLVTPLVIALAFLLLRLLAEYALSPLDRIAVAARRTAEGRRGERLHPDRTDTRLGQMASAYDGMLDALEQAVDDAEAARDETEQLLERDRRILATAREAFVTVDDLDRIIEWNDEARRVFGWTREEAMGRTFAGTVTPVRPGRQRALRSYVRPGAVEPSGRVIAFTGCNRGGEEFPARMVAWTTVHGGQTTTSAFLWDVTQQTMAEEAISRLAAIVESAEEAMFSTTLDGDIVTWNSAAEAMYGYTAGEAIGQHVDLIVPEDLRPTMRASLQAVENGRPVERFETVRRCQNGTTIEVAVSMSPVRDRQGRVSAASSIDRDITEERWIARQLDNTLAALEATADEARESEAATRRFLDDAAHQLRAPITNVHALAEALLRSGADLDPADRDDLLSAVYRETGRAGRLVAGLLRIARLHHGAALAPAPCNMVALCEEQAATVRAAAPDLEVTVAAEGPVPVGTPSVDRHAVGEVLSNLLANARRHAESSVAVTLRRNDGWVEIEVADDGPGLPDGMVDAAFDRFVSLDGRGGSGLGLPIARELARAHGGDVTYEGKAFVVRLPAG
ncbi:MAG TPA: PAS domain S-box protein [Acidimicrobiales bacterium]|nr:PAS domain S-box protein [Acidimicrobiales bacterium]